MLDNLSDDNKYLLRLLAGGTAIGGGLGLVTSLLNHMNTLREESVEDRNKDTLHARIPVKRANEGGDISTLALALSAPALLGSGFLGWRMGRMAGNKYQAYEMDKRLQDAEEEYRAKLLQEQEMLKGAADGVLNPDSGTRLQGNQTAIAGLFAALGIPFMASAVLANTMLDKQYPKDKSTRDVKPMALRPEFSEDDPDQEEKLAAFWGPEFQSRDEAIDAAMPFLTEVVLSSKQASESVLPDMVATAGMGKLAALEEAVMINGLEDGKVLQMFKGASSNELEPVHTSIGVYLLSKSGMVGASFRSILAAEALDMAPETVKVAASIPKKFQDWLIKWAALHSRASFAVRLEKKAGATALTEEEMANHLQGVMGEEPMYNLAGNSGMSEDSNPDIQAETVQVPPLDDVDQSLLAGKL